VISVLLPSRGRPAALLETMDGLLSLAASPGDVEILIAADPDDSPTVDLVRSRRLPGRARMWVAPERYGYKRICEYYNALDAMAGGVWSFLWNDDATVLTPRWDEVIRAESPAILWPQADLPSPDMNLFPVWPTAWTRHLGHVSLDQSTDMWIARLGEMTGTQRKIPVSVRHAHMFGDATANDRDATADVGTFHTAEMQRAREADAAKLRELLSRAVR
jgi:hypothetical protein